MRTLKIQWDADDSQYKLSDSSGYVGMLCDKALPWVDHLNEIKISVKNPKKKGWFKVHCSPAIVTKMKGHNLDFLGRDLRVYLQKFCGVDTQPINEYSFYAKFE
jgi:hypothetical protein